MTDRNALEQPFGHYAPSSSVERLIRLARAWSVVTPLKPISSLCRRLALRLIGPSAIDYDVRGGRARLHPNGNTAEKRALLNPGRFDPMELDFITAELPVGGVFLDIGANVGLYSIVAADKAGPEGTILAFEPNPPVYERLRTNVLLNAPGPGAPITPIQRAVTDRDTHVEFLDPGGNLGEGRVIGPGGTDIVGTIIKVPGAKLLDILIEQNVSEVDIVKIDIEGHEKYALAPFFSEAPKILFPKYVIVERGEADHWNELVELFESAGYRSHMAGRMNEIMVRD
jgi:FkbM family methyltransferase